MGDSNPRPSEPQSDALPTELIAPSLRNISEYKINKILCILVICYKSNLKN